MASLEFVQVYMDDLLIITRQTLGKHLQKLEIVLTRLHDVRLEVNALKSLSVHMKKILSYILTNEGIKPQLKKVQSILALNLRNNTSSEWYDTTRTCGQDVGKCWPLSLT